MSSLQPYSAAGGVSRGTPAHAAVPAEPPPFQRLQFGGRRLLGGCVAWDRASGLLAVELQAEDSSRPGGGAAVAASVAILDPQAPETHFVVHVPASSGAEAGEGLAALLWSPPSTRHMLLAMTSNGVGYEWTMDDPGLAAAAKGVAAEQGAAGAATGAGAAGAAGATAAGGARGIGRGGSGSRKGRGVSQVPCVNQWFGRLAFRFQLPADSPGASQQLRPSAASSGGSAEVEEQEVRQFAARRQRPRLLCCRFLEASAAAAAWDVGAALPVAGTAPPAAEVVAFYQQKGLEQAFAPAAAAAAAAAAALAPGQPDQPPLHWLRPGLLCVAAVTCSGQLLLACRGRGSSAVQSGSEPSSGSNGSGSQGWAVAAPVQLPLPPPPPVSLSADGPGGEAAASSQLLLAADVAAAATGGLLVAASVTSGGTACGSGGGAELQQQQEVLLFEVTGPPATVKAAAPGQQQHQAARLSLPDSPIAAGAAALSLTFLPGGDASGSSSRLLIVASKGGSGDGGNGGGGSNSGGGGSATTARLLTCTSSGRALNGGLHSWQLDAGPEERLCAAAAPAATCTACCPDSGSLAVLLPGRGHLLRLHTGSRSSFAGKHSGGLARVGQPIIAMPPHGALGPPTGLAVSPHGLFAAVAAAGGSAVLLLPLLQQPEREGGVEQFMLQLAKRCCVALLAGSSGGGSGWDLATTAAAACGTWGHQGLQFTQQVVDAAVQAVREDARPQYSAAWGRLKAALLAAAAGASPAAAADFNASSVTADAAARDWMATAADVFEQHLPDKGSRAVAASKGAAALGAEDRAGLLKMMPARYWGVWAADFSCYLTRCLLFWLKLKQKGPAKPSAATAAACDAFTAQQNASTDCLPCIRLLSDAEFYRSFSRLVNATNQLQRVLSVLHGGTKQRSNFTMLIEQLQLVQDMAVLLKALYAAFKQAQSEQASGSAGTDTHPAGYAGAWTLVCGQPPCSVHWKAVAGALQKLKQQGSSNLLDRVRQHWKQQAATEEGESVEALLDAAAQLGLLASSKQAGGNGGNGTASRRSAAASLSGDGNDAAAAAAAAKLLQMRAVALAAAEVGQEVWEGAGQPPLPAPLAADSFWGLEQQEEGEPGGEEERRDRQRQQQLSQAERNNQAERWPGAAAAARCQAWERDRNLALGVPAAAGMGDGAAAAFEGSLDVLTGRPLTWDVGISHACTDGGGATAELQRAALTPGGLEGWQAAFAVASPTGGQRWKRLRLE